MIFLPRPPSKTCSLRRRTRRFVARGVRGVYHGGAELWAKRRPEGSSLTAWVDFVGTPDVGHDPHPGAPSCPTLVPVSTMAAGPEAPQGISTYLRPPPSPLHRRPLLQPPPAAAPLVGSTPRRSCLHRLIDACRCTPSAPPSLACTPCHLTPPFPYALA